MIQLLTEPAISRQASTFLCDPGRLNDRTVPSAKPVISVVIINYNGVPWLERCLASLRRQTIADQIEVIVADNASQDRSDRLAAELMWDWPQGQVLRHKANFGYAEGNNLAASQAQGRYLLFLNNDTWLEPDCLENLLEDVESSGAAAATPLIMDYVDNRMQSIGEAGFDIFGLLCGPDQWAQRREIFVACGPAILVERKWFYSLGGFDPHFFMYAEEYDLCWRLWMAGQKVILAPRSRVHHRGTPTVNPRGGENIIESRTSDTKRFYANRNNLLVVLKNAQHLLLMLVPLQIALLVVEAAVVGLFWARRWSHVRKSYIAAIGDCWRLRRHILSERRRVRSFRQRGDFWMLRFFRAQVNRWREYRRLRRLGTPIIDAR